MSDESAAKLTFFPVSSHKFMVLSIATFGIYPLFWFYENWKRIRDVEPGSAASAPQRQPYFRIQPLWRASFAPFYGIALLNRIKERAVEDGITVAWSPVVLGTAFLGVSLLALLPDPWWLLSIGMFTPLLAPLDTCLQINAAAGNPGGLNHAYSVGNIATIVIGALVWILLIVGMSIVPPALETGLL